MSDDYLHVLDKETETQEVSALHKTAGGRADLVE